MLHLKELREARKLLQKDVASSIRVDRTTYAKYESGTSEPSYEILRRLCTFYNVSSDYLIFGCDMNKNEEKTMYRLTPDEKEFLEGYRSLSEQGQQYLRQTMEMVQPLYIKHYTDGTVEKHA